MAFTAGLGGTLRDNGSKEATEEDMDAAGWICGVEGSGCISGEMGVEDVEVLDPRRCLRDGDANDEGPSEFGRCSSIVVIGWTVGDF
jgi:hypothetical protein